jgi:hypothetical protein
MSDCNVFLLKKLEFCLFIFCLSFFVNSYSDSNQKKTTSEQLDVSNNNGWLGIKGAAFPNSFSFFMRNIHLHDKTYKFGTFKKDTGFQEGVWERPQQFHIVYRGILLGTFINTFYERCYTLGIKRNIFRKQIVRNIPLYYSINYGLGVVYGYDKKLLPIADKLPILPYAIVGMNLELGFFGIEGAISGKVFNLFLYLKFTID